MYKNKIRCLYLQKATVIYAILLAVLCSFFLYPTASFAENKVKTNLINEQAAITAGKPFRLGILLNAEEGWHTYYKNPGDAGLPTELKWELPQGFTAGEIEWPAPETFDEDGLTTYGYQGKTLLPVTITAPQQLNEASYKFIVTAQWLTCNKICIPESANLSIELPASSEETILGSEYSDLFPKQQQSLSGASSIPALSENISAFQFIVTLSLALIGGIILNVMPCVLPVLSLKTLALVRKSGHVRSHTAKHGIAYTIGIVLSFAAISGILIALQKGGEAVGWGFQMQSPAFVGFLIYLLFLIGLSLSGAFHIPVLLGGVGNKITDENSVKSSFFTGVLATMVATPCTAPFMASAVGAALLLPPWAAILVFVTLGFGLALPFLLISVFPSLLRFLPKPGEWMEKLKEFLAFPMYASVIWLLWVLGIQTGIDGIILILSGLLLIIFTIWQQRANANCHILYRIFFIIAAVVMLSAILVALSQKEPDNKNYNIGVIEDSIAYSPEKLSELIKENKAVYVDATAAWCISCQLNKKRVLNSEQIKQLFKDNDVVFMTADWTLRNQQVTEFLHEFGYDGVPLNVFYPKGGKPPVILPQILSKEIVIEAVTR